MKYLFLVFAFLLIFSACQQDNKPGSDDLQRQEEVPSPERPNDFKLDRDVLDQDELDLKK